MYFLSQITNLITIFRLSWHLGVKIAFEHFRGFAWSRGRILNDKVRVVMEIGCEKVSWHGYGDETNNFQSMMRQIITLYWCFPLRKTKSQCIYDIVIGLYFIPDIYWADCVSCGQIHPTKMIIHAFLFHAQIINGNLIY